MGKQSRRSHRKGRVGTRSRTMLLVPAFQRIKKEVETSEPQMSAETTILRAIRRFVTEGFGNSLLETNEMAKQFVAVTGGKEQAIQNIAASFEAELPWHCSPETIDTALKNMVMVGMPPQIVEGMRTAQLPARDQPFDMVRIKGHLPNPEPAPTDCMACNEPHDHSRLVKCNTAGCSFLQCMPCLIRNGGGASPHQGCMRVHAFCPECKKPSHIKSHEGGEMLLTELPPELLVVTLDNLRGSLKRHMSRVNIMKTQIEETVELMNAHVKEAIESARLIEL